MSRVKPVTFDQLYLLNCTRLTETSNTNIVDTDSWVKPAVGDRRLLTHFRWTIQKALTRAFSYERMSQFCPGVYCLGRWAGATYFDDLHLKFRSIMRTANCLTTATPV